MVMPVRQRCPKCGQEFMGSDALGRPCLRCEGLELDQFFDVPFVFWRCPEHPQGGVSWLHKSGEQSVAECDTCGRTSLETRPSEEQLLGAFAQPLPAGYATPSLPTCTVNEVLKVAREYEAKLPTFADVILTTPDGLKRIKEACPPSSRPHEHAPSSFEGIAVEVYETALALRVRADWLRSEGKRVMVFTTEEDESHVEPTVRPFRVPDADRPV